jgi:hypothetical protein
MVSEINSTKQSDLTSYFFMVSEINSTEQSDLTSYFLLSIPETIKKYLVKSECLVEFISETIKK